MKKLISFLVITTSLVLVFSACGKEDNTINQDKGIHKAVFNSNIAYGNMTDQDGNVYKTVSIGSQTWMAENLRATKYNDGTEIPNIAEYSSWKNQTAGAYCTLYNINDTDIINLYGLYYNWYAINSGKLAPKGWHVPTDAEWSILVEYLGGKYVASGKLKETGIQHWNESSKEVTNETGFTALPGGERYISTVGINESFAGGAATGCWWTASECDKDLSWAQVLYNSDTHVYRLSNYKVNGLSVRLIKD